jgi:hypothetical protein
MPISGSTKQTWLWRWLHGFLQIWLRIYIPASFWSWLWIWLWSWLVRWNWNLSSGVRRATVFAVPRKDEDMKRLMVVVAVCLAVSVPSFAAEHVVTHSAKVAGKDTYKAAKYSVKETGKFLKFVF